VQEGAQTIGERPVKAHAASTPLEVPQAKLPQLCAQEALGATDTRTKEWTTLLSHMLLYQRREKGGRARVPFILEREEWLLKPSLAGDSS